jgi:hypothetical protein
LNAIVPVAPAPAVSVAVSLIGSPTVAEAVALVVMPLGQLLTLTGSGATKSLISDVKESDERLFRYAEPNVPHAPSPNRASKEIAASPNV